MAGPTTSTTDTTTTTTTTTTTDTTTTTPTGANATVHVGVCVDYVVNTVNRSICGRTTRASPVCGHLPDPDSVAACNLACPGTTNDTRTTTTRDPTTYPACANVSVDIRVCFDYVNGNHAITDCGSIISASVVCGDIFPDPRDSVAACNLACAGNGK